MCASKLNEDNQIAHQQTTGNTNLLFLGNLSAYLSLMLPSTYFYGGWFWHAETAFGENVFSGSVEREVYAKAITVVFLYMYIVLTIVALENISTYLFSIRTNTSCIYLLKSIILLVAYFMFKYAKAFLLAYLSRMLSDTYFYKYWFWHAERVFGENIFSSTVEREAWAKLVTVLLILIVFTILPLQTIGTYLFSVQTNWWMYLLKAIILLAAYFMFEYAKAFLLAYLPRMLLDTYFYGDWFWYAATAFGQNIFSSTVEREVWAKLVTVLLILIVFIILALQTTGTYLFSVQTNWRMYLFKAILLVACFMFIYAKAPTVPVILIVSIIWALAIIGVYSFYTQRANWYIYLCKTIILLVAFFVLTLILSIVILYTVHYQNPLSIDSHEWIVTRSGLSVTDQAITNEIERFDFDVDLYDQTEADLTRIIEKYKLKHKQKHRWTVKKLKKLLGQLYLLRGLLLYHQDRFERASIDFNESLVLNPNNVQVHLYMISALNLLGKHDESFSYSKKCVNKSGDPESKALFAAYEDATRWEKLKDDNRKEQRYRKVDVPPPAFFDNPWPTHRQLAELSAVAYSKKPSFSNWIKIDECDNTTRTGYYGIAFRHGKTNETVIAHRGTDNIASLIADYDLFTLTLPAQLHVAQEFTNKIRQTKMTNPNQILWHTGHSLGGAIAEFLVANETLSGGDVLNSLSFAVTFDSPGIMELLEDCHLEKELKFVEQEWKQHVGEDLNRTEEELKHFEENLKHLLLIPTLGFMTTSDRLVPYFKKLEELSKPTLSSYRLDPISKKPEEKLRHVKEKLGYFKETLRDVQEEFKHLSPIGIQAMTINAVFDPIFKKLEELENALPSDTLVSNFGKSGEKSKHVLLRSSEFPVISYLSAPNIVNTMGTHIGLVLRLSPFPPLFEAEHPLHQIYTLVKRTWLRQYEIIIDFAVAHSIEQLHWHRLQTIINCFKLWPHESGIPLIIKLVMKWPKGQQELVRFRRFASEKDSKMLDFYREEDKTRSLRKDYYQDSETQYERMSSEISSSLFQIRAHYRVLDLGRGLLTRLPMELLPMQTQHFLNQQLTLGISKNVLTQLNTKCTVFKLIGENATKLTFDILNFTSHFSLVRNTALFAINDSAIPVFNPLRPRGFFFITGRS